MGFGMNQMQDRHVIHSGSHESRFCQITDSKGVLDADSPLQLTTESVKLTHPTHTSDRTDRACWVANGVASSTQHA